MKLNYSVVLAVALSASVSAGWASGQATGMNVGILRPIFEEDGDARLIWMGDSFSVHARARVPFGAMLAWPTAEWTAIQTSFRGDWLISENQIPGGLRTVSSDAGYLLMPEKGASGGRFGLPVSFVREYFGAEGLALGASAEAIRYRLRDTFAAAGASGRFVNAGDTARARLFYLATDSAGDMAAEVTVRDGGADRVKFDPAAQSRPRWSEGANPLADGPVPAALGQINAAPADAAIAAVFDNTRVVAALTPGFAGSGRYFHPAGATIYKTTQAGDRKPGVYFSGLADASWTYSGFGSDIAAGEPGAPSNQKTFSQTQLTHWLDVTTLDRAQPAYFFYYFDVESPGASGHRPRFEAMIDQAQAAADRVGLESVVHCLVIPHFHSTSVGSGDAAHAWFVAARDAAFDIASERPNVAAVSIYDATSATLFNGSAAAQQWLSQHGFDAFMFGTRTVDLAGPTGRGGDLLDVSRLHPRDPESAAFYARIMQEIILPGDCAGDLNRDGAVDAADLLSVLSGWGTAAAPADVTGDGVADGLDLLRILSNWGGCGN